MERIGTMPISSATKSGRRVSVGLSVKPPSGPLNATAAPGARPRNQREPTPPGATSAQSVIADGVSGVEAIEYARTIFGPNGTETHCPASKDSAGGSSIARSASRTSGTRTRVAVTRARHSRGLAATAQRQDRRGRTPAATPDRAIIAGTRP
jgi:hypothetical protein